MGLTGLMQPRLPNTGSSEPSCKVGLHVQSLQEGEVSCQFILIRNFPQYKSSGIGYLLAACAKPHSSTAQCKELAAYGLKALRVIDSGDYGNGTTV